MCDKEEVMEGLDVGDQNVRPTVQQSNTVVQPDDMQSIESVCIQCYSFSSHSVWLELKCLLISHFR